MSDPTPEEIATLIKTLSDKAAIRRQALAAGTRESILGKPGIRLAADLEERAATALASLQRRAETAEREREEARERFAEARMNLAQAAQAVGDLTRRAEGAESRPADQAKVIEAAQRFFAAYDVPEPLDSNDAHLVARTLDDFRAALSQLAEKGGDKT